MAPGSCIVVVGSHAPGLFVRVKRVPLAGETVIGWDFQEPDDGGKGSNQAVAAGRLGAAVSFVGCVGRDRIGDHGEQMMRDAGVDTHYLFRSETTSSGVGFIILDDRGVPAMVSTLGASGDLSAARVDEALSALADARVLLTQFEIPVEVALHAARRGRERGLTVIVNPAPAPETPVDGLDAASILVPNETEAQDPARAGPRQGYRSGRHGARPARPDRRAKCDHHHRREGRSRRRPIRAVAGYATSCGRSRYQRRRRHLLCGARSGAWAWGNAASRCRMVLRGRSALDVESGHDALLPNAGRSPAVYAGAFLMRRN